MKKDIHPNYGESIVRCACGETFKSGSVKGELKVEICSKCHPFFTGRQKLVDTGGRVDRFKKRYGNELIATDKKSRDFPAFFYFCNIELVCALPVLYNLYIVSQKADI